MFSYNETIFFHNKAHYKNENISYNYYRTLHKQTSTRSYLVSIKKPFSLSLNDLPVLLGFINSNEMNFTFNQGKVRSRKTS